MNNNERRFQMEQINKRIDEYDEQLSILQSLTMDEIHPSDKQHLLKKNKVHQQWRKRARSLGYDTIRSMKYADAMTKAGADPFAKI